MRGHTQILSDRALGEVGALEMCHCEEKRSFDVAISFKR